MSRKRQLSLFEALGQNEKTSGGERVDPQANAKAKASAKTKPKVSSLKIKGTAKAVGESKNGARITIVSSAGRRRCLICGGKGSFEFDPRQHPLWAQCIELLRQQTQNSRQPYVRHQPDLRQSGGPDHDLRILEESIGAKCVFECPRCYISSSSEPSFTSGSVNKGLCTGKDPRKESEHASGPASRPENSGVQIKEEPGTSAGSSANHLDPALKQPEPTLERAEPAAEWAEPILASNVKCGANFSDWLFHKLVGGGLHPRQALASAAAPNVRAVESIVDADAIITASYETAILNFVMNLSKEAHQGEKDQEKPLAKKQQAVRLFFRRTSISCPKTLSETLSETPSNQDSTDLETWRILYEICDLLDKCEKWYADVGGQYVQIVVEKDLRPAVETNMRRSLEELLQRLRRELLLDFEGPLSLPKVLLALKKPSGVAREKSAQLKQREPDGYDDQDEVEELTVVGEGSNVDHRHRAKNVPVVDIG